MIVVSIDLSINGTGITVYDSIAKEYKFFAFPCPNKIKFNNKAPKSSIMIDNEKLKYDLTVFMVEQRDELELKKLIRIAEMIFVNAIYPYYKLAQEQNEKFLVCMEEQVMSSFKSSAMIQIGEFNGILKYLINKRCNLVPYLINNRTCKKIIAGNGNAKKDEIFDFYSKHEVLSPIIDDIIEQTDIKALGTFLEDVIDSFMLFEYFKKLIIKNI